MKNKPIVTMQTVADAAGLSRTGVSLALRKHPSIPKITQERVAKEARRLGYRVNPLVSALMGYHLKIKRRAPKLTIALITSHPPGDPWTAYPVYRQMFSGAQARAEELGWRLEEFNLGTGKMPPDRLRQILHERGIGGAIIAPLPAGQTELAFDVTGLAVLGLGFSVRQPVIMRITSDLFQLTRTAVTECFALGYRRIGFAISHEMSERLEHRMLAGMRQGLFDCGLGEVVPALMPPQTANFASQLATWIRQKRPDVVLLGTFDRATIKALPLTVGLVASSEISEFTGVTHMAQDFTAMAGLAVDQLIERIYVNSTGPLPVARTLSLAAQWI